MFIPFSRKRRKFSDHCRAVLYYSSVLRNDSAVHSEDLIRHLELLGLQQGIGRCFDSPYDVLIIQRIVSAISTGVPSLPTGTSGNLLVI